MNTINYCRIVALCLAFSCAGWAAETSGFVARTYSDGKGHSLPYRLFIPDGYDASKPYPLVLYFHGAGGRGSDNLKQMTDVPRFLVLAEPANQRKWPCFILAPQCPENQQWAAMPWSEPSGVGKFTSITWPMEASLALVDSLPQEYRGIDVSRLYVTGISMGGYGTWDAVCRVPKKFKAAVPICGGGDPGKIAQVTELKNLRVWAYHSADDRTVPAGRTREMIDVLKALKGIQPRYTEFPDGGHDAYTRAYADPALLPWLFAGDGRVMEVGTRAQVQQWDLFETSFESAKAYTNSFMDIEVDVIFKQGERQWRVPAFWAGGGTWKVRFAPPVQGEYTYRVECTDKANAGLNGKEQALSVAAYTGDNPLLKHGFLKVSSDKRHFEHADGTPFFWLGDTWWKGLCKRLTWEGFQELTADRKAKGFSLVQIVCGPYPDEDLFETRWENEGGKPYETKDFSVVNPEYFKYSDRRIKHLVDNGIVPAIVGGWGRGDCDGMKAGVPGLKRHWRNVIARYGAYPTVWIIGGESQGPQWTEVAKYVQATDPYHRPSTIHPEQSGRSSVTDESAINFDMLQTGHGDWDAGRGAIPKMQAAYGRNPPMPVLIGEYCYEGHMQTAAQDVQRYVFWASMLSGSAGLTYGAAGIWHASVEGDPGTVNVYDLTTWKQGMNYPGSTQLGLGKKLLEQFPWARFEPHPEWAPGCFAAGIPGGMRVIYLPRRNIYNWSGFSVNKLQPGVPYSAFYFDPVTGRRFDLGVVSTASGSWNTPNVPSPQDWVLVMEAPDLGAPVILPGAKAGQAYSDRMLPEGAAFAKVDGGAWLTIQPDGRVSGTPDETDVGGNSWIVSVTKPGAPPTFIPLQIPVAGSPGIHFAENFSRYSGNQNGTQYQSGLKVAYHGNVAGWTHAGTGTIHAVDRANSAGQLNPPNWAVMIWQDNVITSRSFAANAAGHAYCVNFEAGAAVYADTHPDQATRSGDALLIEVLRGDNSVLARHIHEPGAWTGKMAFVAATFEYKGDGSGDIRLRIGPSGTLTSGRFQGAIDNVIVRELK